MKKIYRTFLAVILLFCIASLNAQELTLKNESVLKSIVEVGVISIDDIEIMWPDFSYEPKATVKNYGNKCQTFTVKMKIESTYTSTKQLTLLPNTSVTVIFDPLVFKKGVYVFSINLHCDDDNNNLNDTLSASVIVPEIKESKRKKLNEITNQ